MNLPLTILTAAGAIGAVDVLYFHLYRFRLFAQDGSVAEEVTHLCRHAIFLALVALLSAGTPSPAIDNVILGLFAVDMVNSIADVLLERRSRERLGGLPSIEYLVHIVSTFAIGLAVASYILLRGTPLPAPVGLLAWQVHATLVAGVIIFLTEGALFAGVVMRRRRLASGPLPSGTPFPIARP